MQENKEELSNGGDNLLEILADSFTVFMKSKFQKLLRISRLDTQCLKFSETVLRKVRLGF